MLWPVIDRPEDGALRVEAKEEVLARHGGGLSARAADAVRSCLTVAQEVSWRSTEDKLAIGRVDGEFADTRKDVHPEQRMWANAHLNVAHGMRSDRHGVDYH